ncbi:hypothetical protein CSB45_02355 [candidate division KSB3 bacterium]|uniref:ABC transporter substrate-binding protein n=1 Tax=candidate division KSB3 bacterium TaxID=2044937 RepID=A0A2G6EAR8_9BACT|nr:MAG: hypothetical protein CSB45_02355 [candidate division KSB3 bacterium]PIE30922.1 MAG: hypothetical protein CSA57_00965 [candidate division KSB3 bacterium]
MKIYLRNLLGAVLAAAALFLPSPRCSCAGLDSSAGALVIAIVQPQHVDAYQEAVQGFLEYLRRHLPRQFTAILYEKPEKLYAALGSKDAPPVQLIVTIGTTVTADVIGRVHDIPVLFSMLFNPESILQGRRDVVGASLNIPFALQLELISTVLPRVKTVGLLYDPEKNDSTIHRYLAQAEDSRLRLKVFPVTSAKELPNALSKVAKEADALLGIVDSSVYSSRTTELVIRYTLKKQLPFIGISPSYVKAGALCSLTFDSRDVGRQTAQLALNILGGTPVEELEISLPEKIHFALNLKTADMIDVSIPGKIQDQAAIVYE